MAVAQVVAQVVVQVVAQVVVQVVVQALELAGFEADPLSVFYHSHHFHKRLQFLTIKWLLRVDA
ncbi:MAG: hypothetical protein ACE3JN_08075 [Ectobacillus sp.]